MTINIPVINVTINYGSIDFQATVLANQVDLKKEIEELKNMLNAAEQAIIDGFNTATTAVGDRIAALVAAGNTDSPEFLAALQGEIDTLKSMGTAGPVVPVTPDPSTV